MGWKAVKEHYRIKHLVHVGSEGICIGSPYISDIIVISPQGKAIKRYEERGNEDLARYQREMDADPQMLERLVASPDAFERSITVYTYEGGRIVEAQCEQPGYPNCTHDGRLMYDNTFSTDRAYIVDRARANASAGVSIATRSIAALEKDLARARATLAECQADLQALQAE